MKNIIKIGAIAAGAYVVINYLKGRKKAMQNLQFVPLSLAIDSRKSQETGFASLFYKVKIRLINNEQQPVIVRAIDLTAFYKGKQVSRIIRDADFIVPQRGNQTIDLFAEIRTANIVTSIIEILQNLQNPNITIRIKGTIDTDLGTIPVDYTKKLV
jgi:hypothetical protein